MKSILYLMKEQTWFSMISYDFFPSESIQKCMEEDTAHCDTTVYFSSGFETLYLYERFNKGETKYKTAIELKTVARSYFRNIQFAWLN